MTRFAMIAILVGATSTAFVSEANAHAFHITVAEAEVNHKTGHIEIAMRVHPGDLELALGRIAKRRIRLEKEPKIDAMITKYLQRTIHLRSKTLKSQSKPKSELKPESNDTKKQPQIKWVGKEVSVKWAWLYFEIPTVKELDGSTLTNRVFHEILADQENTMVLTDGKRKQTFLFRKDKPSAKIELRTSPANRRPQPSTGSIEVVQPNADQ